ncbi:serine/threonine-protein phosphatase 7 long form homolog [Rutidosis leptorrhynchoides]|uniref:serine/threonine-protein phosphatase 7 long form homolog n=1 Tax=Rutidosis leptorrhynchoides TaxID=125765 RepID=UPI003A9A259C
MAQTNQVRARSEPVDSSLLFLQAERNHRSYAVFTKKLDEDTLITPRRADLSFWQHIKQLPNETINEHVQVYLDNVGLGLLAKLGKQRLDWSLVTAMIERWRPETHTFHLPIDGDVFSGIWYETNDSDWIPFVETYLGISRQAIGNGGILRGRILISVLITKLNEEVGDTIESHQQRARVYILAMMGGILFSDANAYDVPLSFLHTIVDLSPANRISWGSAVLSHLYRNLCKAATNYEAKAINGSLLLVQQWVYERIPSLAPILRTDVRKIPEDLPPNQISLIPAPYGSRWHGKRTNKNTPAHFIWQPYDDELFARLPEQCTADRPLWSYRGPIIFWATIETHLPDRVCRQFGWGQPIPGVEYLLPTQTHHQLHKTNLSMKRSVDMSANAPQATYIAEWNDRANRIFVGRDGGGVSRGYYDWYKARTVVHITDPGTDEGTNTYPNWAGTTNVYEEGLWRMQDMAFAQMQPNSQPNPQTFYDMPHNLLSYAHHQQPDAPFE